MSPPLTTRRVLRSPSAVLSALIVLLTLALVPSGAGASPGAESGFVGRINGLRASRGLAGLAVDGQLTGVARGWASHMADVGAISHNPSLSSQVRGGWRKLGENVGTGGSVDALHQAFVNSPGHYANLVDPAFTHLGVGVVERNGVLWTAHVFMAAAGAAPAPSAAPPRSGPGPRAGLPPAGTRRAAPVPRRLPAATGTAGPDGPAATPPPPPPPPPEPTALPALLVDLRQLDRRS